MRPVSSLEDYFSLFRQNIIGCEQCFESPFGRKRILYADWTASGRAYGPIEARIQEDVLPFFANTHTETTITGRMMSGAYEQAKTIVKDHVHAREDDVLVFCGSGMTAAVNKLQRIMGLRLPDRVMDYVECLQLDEVSRPLVLVTHMEHHSNHISWLETIATVEMIRPCENGNVDLGHLRQLLEQFKDRKNKIAAITACSNVTGIETPYHEIASVMHEYGGLCFVDFACSAPYVHINMHPEAGAGLPEDPRRPGNADLDAIYFSCHKFLGGPGTPGVLIFNRGLYKNCIPDQPGGGTVLYSNPWKVHEYITNVEQREDGGTPPILQGIKAALCIRLKEEMGVERILRREEEMLLRLFDRLSKISRVEILGGDNRKRLGVISFMVKDAHYSLIVKILNDRFGVQARGGCSCAGTYGHLLLRIDKARSYEILNMLRAGEMLYKPGWVRLSIHPTMTNAEIDYIMDAIETTVGQYEEWRKDYVYDPVCHEYAFSGLEAAERSIGMDWFNVPLR
ncbi:MAG TPA: aminotransferase class V-fold PLP-dependent enzyme [Puia sp.]|nr:aminotransferase class V-fold PLP-dependent enzyme [Puia sp.]